MGNMSEIVKPVDEVLLPPAQWIALWPWFDLAGDPKLDTLWHDYEVTRRKACIPEDWPARNTKAITLWGYDPDTREKVELNYYPDVLVREAMRIGNYTFKEKGAISYWDDKPYTTNFNNILRPYQPFAQARCALVKAIAKYFKIDNNDFFLISFPKEDDEIV